MKDKIIEILREEIKAHVMIDIRNSQRVEYYESTGIHQAADRLEALFLEQKETKWYYPEKGELPANGTAVYFCFPHPSVEVNPGVFYQNPDMFFKPGTKQQFPAEDVWCWCNRMIPQRPK